MKILGLWISLCQKGSMFSKRGGGCLKQLFSVLKTKLDFLFTSRIWGSQIQCSFKEKINLRRKTYELISTHNLRSIILWTPSFFFFCCCCQNTFLLQLPQKLFLCLFKFSMVFLSLFLFFIDTIVHGWPHNIVILSDL